MEFVDHLSLEKYLNDSSVQKQFNDEAKKTSFLLGKFAFRKQDRVDDMVLSGINELTPLYEKL